MIIQNGGQTEAARAAAPAPRPRPYRWSLRRELWENRSIVIAPLAVAGVLLLGFLVSLFGLKQEMLHLDALTPGQRSVELAHDFGKACFTIIATAVLVAVFYCLDALHGERRDRSILFWKSLPVSDLTAVLAKATVPLLVLPLVAFAIIVVEQLVFLVLDSLVLLGSGLSSAPLWTQPPLIPMFAATLYGLLAMAQGGRHPSMAGCCWSRPGRGAPPSCGRCCRRSGCACSKESRSKPGISPRCWATAWWAGTTPPSSPCPRTPWSWTGPNPLGLLGSAGFWLGLLVAAGFLAGSVRLRRYRQPI